MEILSKVHAKNLVKWAEDKKNTVVLSADLTSSSEIDLFRDKYGNDVIFLVGGGLFKHGPDIIKNSRYFRSLVEKMS